jgi:hypothetical protein
MTCGSISFQEMFIRLAAVIPVPIIVCPSAAAPCAASCPEMTKSSPEDLLRETVQL